MGTSDNSTRRFGNNSLWGQNGAMRVHSQFLEDLSWQALSLWRRSKESHKLGDCPKVGEEHPFSLPANRRPVINTLEASRSGRSQKDGSPLAICGPVDLLPPDEGSIRPDHHMGRLRASAVTFGRAHDELRQETDTRYCGGVVAE